MSNTYCAMALGFLCTTMITGMENERQVYTSDDLFQAIKVKDCAAVKTIVSQQPALVNEHHLYSDNLYSSSSLMAPLHYAVHAKKKCCKMVQLLIDLGARCNEPMLHKKYTPLHVSLLKLDFGDQSEQERIIKLLIKRGANVEQKDKKGQTPLYMLLVDYEKSNCFELALYLLKHGADINAQDNKGNTVLHNEERYADIEWLLGRGANPMVCNKKGVCAFECGIKYCMFPSFANPFEKVGILFFSHVNNVRYNPLLLLKNDAAMLKNIMKKGPGEIYSEAINKLAHLFTALYSSSAPSCSLTRGIITNRYGTLFNKACIADLEEAVGVSTIHYAAKLLMDHYRMIVKNIDGGYDFCIQEIKKYPCVVHYCPQQAFELFRHAIKQKNNRFLRFLLDLPRDRSLVKKNYSPNLTLTYSDDNTLLHVAVMEYNPLAIELLIANEVDFTAINIQSATAFDMAYYLKNEACIEAFYKAISKKLFSIPVHSLFYKNVKDFLKKRTKDGRFDINWRDEKGKTVLYKAIRIDSWWVKALLKMGARVNICSNKGEFPLSLVLNSGCFTGRGEFLVRFLAHDPLITQDMMHTITEAIKDGATDEQELRLLQTLYDEQQCCVCYEHCQEMNNIPCKNYHQGTFICKNCCSQVKNNTNACPCCRDNMGEYGT